MSSKVSQSSSLLTLSLAVVLRQVEKASLAAVTVAFVFPALMPGIGTEPI